MERLTTRDLAARTHLAPQTILNYVKDGTITPTDTSPDGRYYFEMSVADELITRSLLKKYPKHTAIVVLYTDEDSMKTFENTYNTYLENEGILRIDNLTEKVSEVRKNIEGNALRDRLFCMHLCNEITRKHDGEIRKLYSDLPTRIMQNPKLEDRTLLLENLDILVSEPASVMEKLNPNDKKIVQGAFYWLEEQKGKIHERYAMNEIDALLKQLKGSQNSEERFEFPLKTKTIENMVRKERQSFYSKSLDKALEKLKEGYQSLMKIDCSKEQGIYELLYKTRFTENIKLYGYDNATEEMQEAIQFLNDTKKLEFGEMEVR